MSNFGMIESMKITWSNNVSWKNPSQELTAHNGYGYATDRALWAVKELGYHISSSNTSPDVHIWFDRPQFWTWHPGAYRIGYLPWESTKLKPGWVKAMNKADEIWTPSPLIAKWYAEDGVKVPIYVYEHGVDDIWTPQERKVEGTFKFLHLGAEGARKGGLEVMRGLRKAFPNGEDVSLTLKMINDGWNIPAIGRTSIINSTMSTSRLVELFHNHHAYVYPSWGEGFGLTPLQALATGMPTVTVPDWAPYAKYIDGELMIDAEIAPSPWPEMHPGYMYRPSLDDMIDKMRFVYTNYQQCQAYANSQVPHLKAEYDWLRITQEVFEDLEKRL